MKLALVLALAVFAAGNASAASFDPGFQGTWIGDLIFIDPELTTPIVHPDLPKTEIKVRCAIEVKGDDIRVLTLRNDNSWVEVKPGAFVLMAHKTNAIVAAINSSIALDQSRGWVETWNFTLMHKDDDSLYAYWTRAVTNYHMPAGSDPSARFAFMALGELARSSPVVMGREAFAATAPRAGSPFGACEKGAEVCRARLGP